MQNNYHHYGIVKLQVRPKAGVLVLFLNSFIFLASRLFVANGEYHDLQKFL